MRNLSLLEIVARLHPAIWDVPPHGPLRSASVRDRVALNPQPLPPEPDPFLLEAARMTHEYVRLGVEATIRGEDAVRLVSEFVDDWCGTPWPRKWPFPWPGPRPDEGPQPDPWRLASARVVGAVILAGYAARLGEGDLRETLRAGAEKLAEAATSA